MFERDLKNHSLVLASTSSSRAQILRNAGLIFEQQPSNVDERIIEDQFLRQHGDADTYPADLALELASAKALAVSGRKPDALVIGADQVMACGSEIFYKPASLEAAREQLVHLRNRTHSLFSAVSIAEKGTVKWRHCERADLVMRDFSDRFLDEYCQAEGAHILNSVGCYRIEGPGVQLFSEIRGDLFTIMGLPLPPLLGYLRKTGWLTR